MRSCFLLAAMVLLGLPAFVRAQNAPPPPAGDPFTYYENAPGYWVPPDPGAYSPGPYGGEGADYENAPGYYGPPPYPYYGGPGIYFRFGFHSHH